MAEENQQSFGYEPVSTEMFDAILLLVAEASESDLKRKGIDKIITEVYTGVVETKTGEHAFGNAEFDIFPSDYHIAKIIFHYLGQNVIDQDTVPIFAYWVQPVTGATVSIDGQEETYDDAVVIMGMTSDGRINSAILFTNRDDEGASILMRKDIFLVKDMKSIDNIDIRLLAHFFDSAREHYQNKQSGVETPKTKPQSYMQARSNFRFGIN